MSYTRNDIRESIALRLGRRTDLNSYIEDEIRFAQTRLEQGVFLPWFLLCTEQAGTLDTRTYSTPERFLREHDEHGKAGGIIVYDSNGGRWRELTKVSLGYLDAYYRNEEDDLPEVYAISGDEFIFGPTPDAAYSIRIRPFYQGAVPLTSDIGNAWTVYAPDILIGAAGSRVAAITRDMDAKTLFDEMFVSAMGDIANATTAREVAGQEYKLGED